MENIYYIIGALVAFVLWFFSRAKEKANNYENLPENITQWIPLVKKYSQKYDVPFPVAMAVLMVESNGNETARGSAGEYGLYQLKPIAVEDLRINGYEDLYPEFKTEPESNIQAGIAFLRLQYMRAKDWNEGIKSYNQGFKGRLQYPERASQYLSKVLNKTQFFV